MLQPAHLQDSQAEFVNDEIYTNTEAVYYVNGMCTDKDSALKERPSFPTGCIGVLA